MKKSLRSLLLTVAATAVALTMATSAFAADITPAISYDEEAGTVSVAANVFAGLSGQTTIIIYDDSADPTDLEGDDILYINQDDATAVDTFNAMGVKGGLVEGKTYTVKIGGENIAADGILVGEFTIGGGAPDYTLGDVNSNGSINGEDAGLIWNDFLNVSKLEGAAALAADVNENGSINGEDAGLIWNDFLNVSKIND